MSHDDVISMFLERRDPVEFDPFMEACGQALADAEPAARKSLRRYQYKLDIDEVISRAFVRALVQMRDQFLGHDDGFSFKPEFGINFETWFLQIVGLPGQGVRSGIAGNEFNRRVREEARQQSLTDDLPQVANDNFSEEQLLVLEHALEKLEPREQFVVRARSGVHPVVNLDYDGTLRLAAMVQLSEPHPRVMRRRAKLLFLQDRVSSSRLSSKDIGHLLEICDRQVRYINETALTKLQTMLQRAV